MIYATAALATVIIIPYKIAPRWRDWAGRWNAFVTLVRAATSGAAALIVCSLRFFSDSSIVRWTHG